MPKILRVEITDSEWRDLQPLLTHYGEMSFILRKAIKAFIKEKKEIGNVRGEGKGRGAKSA